MDLKQKARNYQDSLDKDSLKEIAKNNWHIGAITSIVFLGFMLRYMPENGMKYLQAADPYFIFRNSQHIALEGTFPQIDFHRYYPYTAPTYLYFKGAFLIPALLWDAGFSLLFGSYLEWAQFYPAMLGAGSILTMYFLGKEFFNKRTGLAAAFFLAVTAAALRRTSAGFFEKEPIGTFMMMVSLLFFTRAWKQESWKNGIVSGMALGLFTFSWGGSQMLWLLYPIIVGALLFINEDIRSMVAAYTPTVLLAGGFAAITNYNKFWITDSLFLFSIAVLGGVWVRYLVEEFNLVSDNYLPYFIPSMSILGFLAAILSPIYSDWVARKLLSVVQSALGATGGVIGGTVQENAPPGASDLATDLGSIVIGSSGSAIELLAALTTPWLLMLFSVTFITTSLLMMLGRKYDILEKEMPGRKHIAYNQSVFMAVLIVLFGLMAYIKGLTFLLPVSIVVAACALPMLLILAYLLDEEASFTLGTLFVLGAAAASLVFTFRFSGGLFTPISYLVFVPALAAAAGSAVLYYFDSFPSRKIEYKWYIAIPLLWVASNLFGATTRSRLVFLSSFAVAFAAGHALSVVYTKLESLDYSIVDQVNSRNLKIGVLAILVVSVVGMNLFSGYGMSQGIRGSPSPSPEIWEPSLDYMQNDTPEGSVILSWWDYGYLYQELGDRASVADGRNAGYYSQETRAVNMPLARYLNTTDRPEDKEFIEKHSADYIWLDHTMIGKFSAVSQIANKDNSQFEVISQLGVRGSLQDSLSRDGNQTVVEFSGRLGRTGVQVFAPIESTNTSMSLDGAPTVRFRNGQTAQIGCVLSEEGKESYDVENGLDYCIAEDPFYSLERGAAGGQARAVLVPEKISDSTFVELYIQDGAQLDYAEKIPEASNGYIKMWKINQ